MLEELKSAGEDDFYELFFANIERRKKEKD